jgi:hypothetical protein
MANRARREEDPEVREINDMVKIALDQTRSLVEEIGTTVIALEEFRQRRRDQERGTDHGC